MRSFSTALRMYFWAVWLLLLPGMSWAQEPVDEPSAEPVKNEIAAEQPSSGTDSAAEKANDSAADAACTNECEVGSGECTELGARLCKMRGKCAVWTQPYQCADGQECTDGRCKSSFARVIVYISLAAMVLGFIATIRNYVVGLRGSPRELIFLFLAKIIEYTAYGAMQLTFVLFLSTIVGLSDMEAGSYIGTWSVLISIITMMVGAVVDAIGIKRTLLIGTLALVLARISMPFTGNFWLVTILGFVPMAVGVAIMSPVISVGIKRFTTKEGAALGFGLFYTLMNVGWALGAWLFDFIRERFGDHGEVSVLGANMHTYQFIFFVALILTIPTLILILFMREGVKRTETGIEIDPIKLTEGQSGLDAFFAPIKKAALETVKIMKDVFCQKAFWVFLGMLAILIGVRLVFLHFHYTFPKYGLRVLGEGVKIGSIYGVLNPVIIVFLVPIVSSLTKKVSSYKMMIFGTILSAGSVFLVTLPEHTFDFLTNSFVGELIYDWWLDVVPADRQPIYMSLVVFITIFTIGEAFWSPRLMQFTAEIAPEGREGTYISLSALPFFLGKLVAGPMSGWLLATYVPEGGDVSNHAMVWVWVGAIAILSPLGLLIFAKSFRAAEKKPAKQAAE